MGTRFARYVCSKWLLTSKQSIYRAYAHFVEGHFFFNQLEESQPVVSSICTKFHRVYEERVLETIDEEQDLLKNLNKGEQIGGTVVSSADFAPSNVWFENQRFVLGLSAIVAILSCLIFFFFFA